MTVTGDNVDVAAEPLITTTVVVTRLSHDEASTFTQVSETSEVPCSLSVNHIYCHGVVRMFDNSR